MNHDNKNKPGTRPEDMNVDRDDETLTEHPVGVGLGAVGAGAAAGVAGGAIAGPIGAVAGAAIGAVVGGLVGKAAAEVVNPTDEAKYWQETHTSRPYALNGYAYDEFSPAYRYGWESYGRHGMDGKTFESVESDLGRGWDKAKSGSRLSWEQAKLATRDAWNRVESASHRRVEPTKR